MGQGNSSVREMIASAYLVGDATREGERAENVMTLPRTRDGSGVEGICHPFAFGPGTLSKLVGASFLVRSAAFSHSQEA
jgi:hypothetical protein